MAVSVPRRLSSPLGLNPATAGVPSCRPSSYQGPNRPNRASFGQPALSASLAGHRQSNNLFAECTPAALLNSSHSSHATSHSFASTANSRRHVSHAVRCEAPASTGSEREQQQTQQQPLLVVPPSFDYNEKMKRQMANPYEYHHELGIYYTRVHPKIIVGSQPQTPADIDRLKTSEDVQVILNLQQDHDITYWGIDIDSIIRRCRDLSVQHFRCPAVDFDPHSLRRELPRMVAVIAKAVAEGKTVYVHCTAGLGRSPAAVITYLFWFSEPQVDLNSAYERVTSLRPCGPKKDAIRGATYDLAKNSPYQPQFEQLPDFAFNDVAQWERDLIRQRVWAIA
ncbi:hypothetical protein CLOM_g13292 [Closterium sp. NIES-68]|nr:hypothetical protein CLOM_g13292 [Closterium sp. NIES-68]GJP82975.1 hypothetical protein CLOP_g13188 [Closterium sp. NIES-67]